MPSSAASTDCRPWLRAPANGRPGGSSNSSPPTFATKTPARRTRRPAAGFLLVRRVRPPAEQLQPVIVASYIEGLQNSLSAPSVKQHLAAIRMLFDWLILGQVIPMNPAAAVPGPKHVVKNGKT